MKTNCCQFTIKHGGGESAYFPATQIIRNSGGRGFCMFARILPSQTFPDPPNTGQHLHFGISLVGRPFFANPDIHKNDIVAANWSDVVNASSSKNVNQQYNTIFKPGDSFYSWINEDNPLAIAGEDAYTTGSFLGMEQLGVHVSSFWTTDATRTSRPSSNAAAAHKRIAIEIKMSAF